MAGGTHCWHCQMSLPYKEVKGRSSVTMPLWCGSGGLKSGLSQSPSCLPFLTANLVPLSSVPWGKALWGTAHRATCQTASTAIGV